jgi:thiol-disulfide isomerase/thioredoxin
MLRYLVALMLITYPPREKDQSNLLLQATLEAIIQPQSIRYDHERLVITDNKESLINSVCYLENNEDDALIGMKFLIKDNSSAFIYNGSEVMLLDDKEKTIRIKRKPTKTSIENYYLYNSILTLKKNLPLIIADNAIEKKHKDTVVRNQTYDLVTIRMFKKTMQSLGGFFPIDEDRWFEYRLVLDKKTHLPVELHQQNFTPSGKADQYIRVSFRNMVVNQKIDDQRMYYSSYLKTYQQVSNESVSITPLAVGSAQVEFSLPRFPDDDLQKPRPSDQPTILYFWIANCGYCIDAIPKLNHWINEYRPKKIEIMGINAYDDKSVIDHFAKKYKPLYPTLYQGAELAKQYGINGFPSVVIVQKRKIIYNGGIDEAKIKAILDKN